MNSERWRENPKGNKEIWKSREMSEVVFMKVFQNYKIKERRKERQKR